MFCEKCGSQLSQDARFCQSCGAAVQIENMPAPTVEHTAFAPIAQVAEGPYVDPAVEARKEELANEAMKLGIISAVFAELGIFCWVWFVSIFFFPFVILGIAFSRAAERRVKEYQALTGGGIVAKVRVGHITSLVALITGLVTLGVLVFFVSLIIFALLLSAL